MSAAPTLRSQRLSELQTRPVEWLVPGFVPLGALTLLVGEPGQGKSLLTSRWAADVTHGAASAHVIIAAAEDSPTAVLRPRLEAAGADVSRVFLTGREGDPPMQLPRDTAALRELIVEHGARLLVIDPLTAHLGPQVNSWQDHSVRAALAPLTKAAEAEGCAVLAIMHLRKTAGGPPLHSVGGSTAFPALARSVIVLAPDPACQERRIVAHVKCNVGPLARSQVFAFEASVPGGAPRLVPAGPSTITADVLMSRDDDPGASALDEAVRFLEAELASGPVAAKQIQQAARDAGISSRTLQRAKRSLRVSSQRQGGLGKDGSWYWSLLRPPSQTDEERPQPLTAESGSPNDSPLVGADDGRWRACGADVVGAGAADASRRNPRGGA